MDEIGMLCPTCDAPLLVPDGAVQIACRNCGENLRISQSDSVTALSRFAPSQPPYAGAVRYVVIQGSPEAYRAWQERAHELESQYMRHRWKRIKWYVATAAVLLLGFTFVAISAVLNRAAAAPVFSDVPLVGLIATILLFLVGASVGSHFQRLEARSKELWEVWGLNEPLVSRAAAPRD